MSADLINLKRARKNKARTEKEKTAEENRLRFGRSKAEKQQTAANEKLVKINLDGHKRES